MIALSTVNLQFQGWFVPISLRPVLGLVELISWLQSGHHVVNFFHLLRISVYKTAGRMWLRILPTVLEEELKVLDFT